MNAGSGENVDSHTLSTWLSIPEAALALGIRDRDVRTMIREGTLAGVRLQPKSAPVIPAGFLVPVGRETGSGTDAEENTGQYEVLAPLRGTLTALQDSGFSAEEAVLWMLRETDLLGTTPLQALHAGRAHEVRRVITSYAF